MIVAKIKGYLNIEPVTAQQVAIGAGTGALAQLSIIWDATTAAIITMPFFVLTVVAVLNWTTGAMNALVDRRFSVTGFAKGPLRWSSYIVLAVVVANMALLLQDVSGFDTNFGVGVITAIYTIAALREADSVIDNVDLPPVLREFWVKIAKRAQQIEDDSSSSSETL